MKYQFIIEKSEGIYKHISTTNNERPYHHSDPFFSWKKNNRKDAEWEINTGGDGRFYLHSGNRGNDIRILILYNTDRIGDKHILSKTLESECIKLLNQDYSNLKWWFDLEESI